MKGFCIAHCETCDCVTYAVHCLATRFIKWPRGEATRVIEEFQRAKNFPGVIGAVDGSFIQLRAPQKDAASYICRKKYPAIHLQTTYWICARVFRNSPLAEFIQKPDEHFSSNSHLLGNAAYSIYSHAMNFNYCLSSTRVAIERAFELLKMRFRILLSFIIACCVMHNICLLQNDNVDILICSNSENIVPGIIATSAT
ncbi:hypothetical protein ACFW04_014481 [Cataglyphis niger]